jgi:carboxyl-terminal processing protease
MRRVPVPSAAIVAVLAVTGGVLFGSATARLQDRTSLRMSVYAKALAVVETEYVEPLEDLCVTSSLCGSQGLVYSSISGMLRTLDPHSSFFPPRDFAAMRERQGGRYYGIGISIVKVGSDIRVAQLFEGSPAHQAGIRRGDIIARVGSEDAKDWEIEEVVNRVKGPKGTTVEIAIRRPGLQKLIPLTVVRDEIRIPSVRTAFMISPGTGYVRLQDFSETTNQELGDALQRLEGEGMRRLLLDLRENPGGPLDQAIAVSNRFLRRGELVVETRGRVATANEQYKATEQGEYTDVPLIVLVNRQSASASEIVTGAIQDHDRGLVIGETTFGKALVQSVYPISGGAGLALTTGRYYTPSGRMIQRPWDESFDEYVLYTQSDRAAGATPAHDAAQLRYTDSGRRVYSGGGVEPDHLITGPVEGFNPTRFARRLWSGAFVGFAERFTKEGDKRPGAQSAAVYKVSPGWQVTDAMVQEFRAYLVREGVRVDDQAFKTDEAFIRAMIRYEVDVDLFGVAEARRNLSAVDPQIQAGLGYFDEAAQLLASRERRASR